MKRLAELRQLQRLRALRERAAYEELERARAEHARCQQGVERRVAQVAAVRTARLALSGWMVGDGAVVLPRLAPVAAAHRAALDDELERAEVELIDERHAFVDAERTLAAARAAWLQSHRRSDAVAELTAGHRRALALEGERRIERETDARAVVDHGRA